MTLIWELVALVLYGATCAHPDAYTDELLDAMRQMHWTIHGVSSKFTRWGVVDQAWLDGGYAESREP